MVEVEAEVAHPGTGQSRAPLAHATPESPRGRSGPDHNAPSPMPLPVVRCSEDEARLNMFAKTLIDADRLGYAAEHGYSTCCSKFCPAEASVKNDVLVGWRAPMAAGVAPPGRDRDHAHDQ